MDYKEEIIMLETCKDVLVVNDKELKIREKKYIVNENEVYEPLDNTLDESTMHYIRCRKSWKYYVFDHGLIRIN